MAFNRYFGVAIVLDDNPTIETLATYWLRSGISRVELCSMTKPETELKDREAIAEATPNGCLADDEKQGKDELPDVSVKA